MNLPWFSFENVHVFCFIQNIIKIGFVQIYFFSLGYGLNNPELPMNRCFIFKKNITNVGQLIKLFSEKILITLFWFFSADKFHCSDCMSYAQCFLDIASIYCICPRLFGASCPLLLYYPGSSLYFLPPTKDLTFLYNRIFLPFLSGEQWLSK